ncbi:MAG: heparinase [Desulfuromonadales bacterium]|nr:MAG: heparinase [Desulfuromonadales bacterium]
MTEQVVKANSLSLYLHTIRHLKPAQLTSRIARRLFPPRLRFRRHPAPGLRPGLAMAPTLAGELPPEGEWTFCFLNVSRSFPEGEIDWRSPEMSKLWRYNLHYFDYLHDRRRSPEGCRLLIDSWIAANPPGTGDGWEPFPVSLRIVNWIKLFLRPDFRGRMVRRDWLESLFLQALWLERNVELHLLANHYFKNGVALLFAGLFFTGHEAGRWLDRGLQILGSELGEQILPDGGHFERSPMYHAMILEDCLDLLNLCVGIPERKVGILCERLRESSLRMVRFLLGMAHPDGEIALFNDAAFGIEATPVELASYCARLTGARAEGPVGELWSFTDTGYYVMAPAQGDRLIIDCGPVGPDYQPGHAHCDTLSFELSLRGRRVIVDSGCCQYVDGDIRQYNRGNAGHNTVTLDGENQSEVWGAHRCARRTRPLHASLVRREDGALHFAGAHDGYCRLAGRPVHHRSVVWQGQSLVVEDWLDGRGVHDVETRLHIHPSLTVEILEGRALIRDGSELLLTVSAMGEGEIEREEGWYAPEFGLRLPCVVLSVRRRNLMLPSRCGWSMTTGAQR